MAAETMTLPGHGVSEHRQLAGRPIQTGKLQARIVPGPFGGLHGQCGGVAVEEIAAQCGATRRQIDQHEAPGLAQTDRRSEAGKSDQPLDHSLRQRVAAKPSHVATPGEQGAQARTKDWIEAGSI